MTSWFRRPHETGPSPEPEPADSPASLMHSLDELISFVNQNAGRLPVESVVAARRVTDAVRDVIDTADNGTLDVYAAISVKGIVNDYLPTTLRTYLALDADTVEQPRPSGRTPNESLLEQLNSLFSGAADVRAAARSRDADALLSQGSFLHTKFTGSDLDL
jgi:hypothetical protein